MLLPLDYAVKNMLICCSSHAPLIIRGFILPTREVVFSDAVTLDTVSLDGSRAIWLLEWLANSLFLIISESVVYSDVGLVVS